MKIAREGNYINHIHAVKTKSQPTADTVSRRSTKNFDEITISSTREPFDEMIFARELSRKIMTETCSPADSQKVDELKAQVQSGSYQIIIDEIAKKMLLS